MFERVAHQICRSPGRVLVLAAVLFAVGGPVGITAFNALDPFRFEDPATESASAQHLLEDASGVRVHADVIVLVDLPASAHSDVGRAKIERVAEHLRSTKGIVQIATPDTPGNDAQIARDGKSAYIVGLVSTDASEQGVTQRVDAAFRDDPSVTIGGSAVATTQVGEVLEKDLQHAELIAFPLLALLSVIFFRGLVASMIPLVVGGLAIATSLFAMRLIHEVFPLVNLSINIVTALGLGLALDYGLFIVSRFREELAKGLHSEAAVRMTLSTTGHAIAFSALTVATALGALLVFRQRFLVSMAIGGTIVTLLVAVVALTVLPALLVVLGTRINALAPGWLQRARKHTELPGGRGRWYRLAWCVMRRPAPVAAISIVLLLALGAPFLHARFVPSDASALTKAGVARDEGPSAGRVARRLAADYSSLTAPVIVVLDGGRDAEHTPEMNSYVTSLASLDGVSAVSEPAVVGNHAIRIDVFTPYKPLSDAARAMVDAVRAVPAPLPKSITGVTADQIDEEDSVASKLPLMLTIIALTTVGLLFISTGSAVLPFKVFLMNLMTVSVALGLLVVVFQDGRFEGVLDYTTQDGIQMAVPLLIFATAFGLSSDYGVFSLSRIREAREAGANNEEAVALGLERTGRLITAAALMFAVAMGALFSSDLIGAKEVGLAVAASVLVDAFLIRVFLVPSLMKLLGNLNWWAPPRLRRVLPAAVRVADCRPKADRLA